MIRPDQCTLEMFSTLSCLCCAGLPFKGLYWQHQGNWCVEQQPNLATNPVLEKLPGDCTSPAWCAGASAHVPCFSCLALPAILQIDVEPEEAITRGTSSSVLICRGEYI